MLVKQDIQKILHRLVGGDPIKIALDGSDVLIRFLDDSSKVSLSTPVYAGGNYIPHSVRQGLARLPAFIHESPMKTTFTIDENHFQIYLHYLGAIRPPLQKDMQVLLEEFGWLAEKWRLYLDERDKNDLIHVKVE